MIAVRRRVPLAAAAVLVLIGVSTEVARDAGWRLNLTASEPLGLYRLEPVTSNQIPRGALVELCPPAWVTPAAFPFYLSGDCSGGGKEMLKTIVGIPGDRIWVSERGVAINGVTLPGSAPRLRSNQYPKILLPRIRGAVVLARGQYWVYGGGARSALAAWSFDSRYFGPIAIGQIRGLAIPPGTPHPIYRVCGEVGDLPKLAEPGDFWSAAELNSALFNTTS